MARSPNKAPKRRRHEHYHEELPAEHEDLFIKVLHSIIHFAVRILAVLMVALILWSVADIVLVLYKRLIAPPFMLLNMADILALFGTFLVVLIAIEIFINITLYIRKDVLPVKLVIATALMAVARKIIVFDFSQISPAYIFATAAVTLALGITYWLVSLKPKQVDSEHNE